MNQLHFKCDFKSSAMRFLDLPVEVCKSNLAIVARSVISQPVEVPPGTYYVSVKMPAGQELFGEVKVGKRSKKVVEVTLAPDPEDESPNESQELLYFLQKSNVRTFPANQFDAHKVQQHVAPKLRALGGNMLRGECNEINRDGWELRSSGIEDVALININGGEAVQLLQLLQPGLPALNVVLPVSSKSGCIVVIKRLKDGSMGVNIHLNNSMANLLWQYTERGYIQQALTTATSFSLSPEKLLEGETKDPIAAAVRAYTIFRFGELEELDDWTDKLKNRFTWLPDGVAIRGEHLARLGEHEQAMTVFLELPSRGLPIFSDGFSYVIDRLRLYISVGESHFQASQLASAREMLERLQRFATFADFSKPLLTFTGINPLTPNLEPLNVEDIESIEGLDIAAYFTMEQRQFQSKEQALEEQTLQSRSMSLEEEFRLIKENRSLRILLSRLCLEELVEELVAVGFTTGYKKNTNVKYLGEFFDQQIETTDEIKKTLNSIYKNSESNENLDNFTQAIRELRQIISEKTRDLERSRAQSSSADTKIDWHNHIMRLQREIAKLSEIEERLESSRLALDWLDPVTKGRFLGDLAKEAGKAALQAHPGIIHLDTDEGLINFSRFRLDIKDFLFLIHGCLLMGKPDLLVYALRQKILPNPNSPLPTTAYAAAFIFIKDQKVDRAMSGKPAKELKTCLNYLIELLS